MYTPTDYFYEAVRYLYCRGVISGYADNTFRPYNNTTRGQLTKIVVLGFGMPIYSPPTPTFRDVPATDLSTGTLKPPTTPAWCQVTTAEGRESHAQACTSGQATW